LQRENATRWAEPPRTEINGWHDVANAYRVIRECHQRYLRKVA
jgi:inorganic pyrophosphatase